MTGSAVTNFPKGGPSLAKRDQSSSGGIVVVGLGRFGSSLALELMGEGSEVLGIDSNPKTVQALAGELTHVVQADSTDEEAMRQLAVSDFEHGVIGIGNNLEASILSASVMITLGVRNVWAKALTQSHARILHQIGVHHIVRPEHDMGKRVAHLVRGKMLDYIELDDGYAIVKTNPPRCLIGLPLGESKPRVKFGVTIVGVKRASSEFTHATPETVVEAGDLIVVAGPQEKIEAFCEMR